VTAYDDAFAACKFVKNTCGVQSINRLDDVETSETRHVRQMMFTHFNKYATGEGVSKMNPLPGTPPSDQMTQVAAWAKSLMTFPVGTCDAIACLALVYLAEKKTSFPVSQMSLVDADHVFVVVGTGIARNGPWAQWDTANAAICDPWADYVGPCTRTGVQTWMEKLGQICEAPFAPAATMSTMFEIASRADWKYKLIP
jgi:hypothetical protein